MKLNQRGQILIALSIIVSIIFITFIFSLYFMTKVNMTASLHDKLTARAIEVGDVGISQMIGDIHRHNVDMALLPYTTSYAIVKYPDSDKTEQVNVTLSVVPDSNDVDGDGNTAEPETDLEGNTIYQIDSRSWASMFTGEKIIKRHVAARISIINLAKYNIFYRGDDVWANYSTLGSGIPIMLNGPYHTNGNLELGGVIYFNNQNMPANPGSNNTPGVTANTSYAQNYTVMCAKQIQQAVYPPIYIPCPPNITYTQNNQTGGLSGSMGYSVVPNVAKPRGTWFDGAHGGFEIHLEPLDFVKYQALAQVIIDMDNLPTFTVYGINHTSTSLVIPNGAGAQTIDIDLSYLGSGTDKDICFGITNYQNALNSAYGLIIFVKGPVSVHGKLAECAAASNNKKVIIISTDSIDIIGDVLYSQDPYMQILDSFSDDSSINAWNFDVINAEVPDLLRKTDSTIFTGAPYKNIDSSCMKVKLKNTSSTGQQVTLKKHFDIVPPPAGINNNKIFFNIRGENPGDSVDVTLRLIDSADNVIASTGPVTVDNAWKRIVLVNNTPSPTLSLSQINDFNNHSHDNLEIVLTNFDNTDRKFYIDELGFAFGQSYPLNSGATNPTNDAIALIAQANIYENANYMYDATLTNGLPDPDALANWIFPLTVTSVPPGYSLILDPSTPITPVGKINNIKYFAANGDYIAKQGFTWTHPTTGIKIMYDSLYYDLRIDAFCYTALDNTKFTVHTPQNLNMFTQYGSLCSFLGSEVNAETFPQIFDLNLANNVSKAIPVGTVIHTYQQLK